VGVLSGHGGFYQEGFTTAKLIVRMYRLRDATATAYNYEWKLLWFQACEAACRSVYPGGNYEDEDAKLRRGFPLIPRHAIKAVFIDAIVAAVRAAEFKFFSTLYADEGYHLTKWWLRLVGLFEPEIVHYIRILRARRYNAVEEWRSLVPSQVWAPPLLPAEIDFSDDVQSGFMSFF
jgi:hypothetical protein